MVSFEIYKRSEECYYAALLDVNGEIILRGNNYDNLLTCRSSIDSILANATDFSNYELTVSHEGKFFFELNGPDGNNVARSVLFETETNVFYGIERVRNNITEFVINDSAFVV
ncbi:MAG: DUF1508 domain-containing protein [Bacteroidia bacterium]|nr:DUF1508 domain-containing protein [Bacteroidia bacterium]